MQKRNHIFSIKGKRLGCLLLFYLFTLLPLHAQYNTDQLLKVGRAALFYEDYVLSIQYFNQAISAKPYLFEPWYYRGQHLSHLLPKTVSIMKASAV